MARLCGRELAFALLSALAGCSPSYSPDTYASSAAQQAAKVEQGVIIGVRQVQISASGVVGAAAGGAAGGAIGSQAGSGGLSAALGAVGGTLVGGLIGTSVEHAQGDTTAWEYVVKETKGDLVSVTQKDDKPLPIGQNVLVIAGSQARIVPDYTVPPPQTAPAPGPVAVAPLPPPTALAPSPAPEPGASVATAPATAPASAAASTPASQPAPPPSQSPSGGATEQAQAKALEAPRPTAAGGTAASSAAAAAVGTLAPTILNPLAPSSP